MTDLKLCVVPTVPVWKNGDSLIFDQKFFDGIIQYSKYWDGPVSVLMRLCYGPPPDFGKVIVHPKNLTFRCDVLEQDEAIQTFHLTGTSIVLAGGDSGSQLDLTNVAHKAGAKIVYIIENTPDTRYQIIALSTNNPLLLLRRFLYIWKEERRRLRAFSSADGIQSNGIPAYREYSRFRENLLYYDTRVFSSQYISSEALETRLASLNELRPLRLAFSGRLIDIKGADHLVDLAVLLNTKGIDFRLNIYGSGDLYPQMKRKINLAHLDEKVILRGVVDFNKVLVPELINSCDIFIILHRQSDPSCTYLETLSCGVPLLGYSNQMLQGLLDEADVGWGSPIDNVPAVADKIEYLDKNREEIGKKARNGLAFAQSHDFESTMYLRIAQLKRIVEETG